ncbi:S-layer protein, partial [Candidatus Marsarchaeota archaeon]|nr:S-layer protein [Candidatus Marsarchaeota archaeon]
MKSANVKKIAAVVAGATLLGVGLAFAGSVSFQNIPIISNSGQPVVQVVVGSGAKPSDGVAAANIAAAIGNLAHASIPITASVNATQAAKVLGASPSQYSLSNQAVYINSTSVTTGPSGTYSFQALIGSVLNRAVKVGPVSATKYLATYASGDAYYNTNYGTTSSPVFSPYVSSGVPMNTTVSAGTNGGGVTFSSFTNSTGDNLLRVTSTNLASLESNAGTSGESEYLWLTGVPVYNQHSKSLQLMDANGAYQIVFNKYIAANFTPSTGNYMNANNATFSLLGQNYTIIKVVSAPSNSITSTTQAISGGKLQVATALAPASTVYVGKNISAGNFTVELTDLGQPASGISPASLNIYYNGQLEKVTSQSPGLQSYNISGHTLAVDVKSTFAGLYSYQKYANIELYSGIENITNNQVFNQTRNPDWYTKILWMNTTTTQTSTSNALPNQLYSIIIYGGTKASANLMPGQSFSFITDPAMYKLSFINSTGVAYDPLSITTTS